MQDESNLKLGFLRSHLHKRQDAVEVAWPGHNLLPPLEGAKGQGESLCGLPGLTLPPSPLAEALLQPAFYRCLASPIVTAPQEGSSQEALNNFNFQKVGKKSSGEGPERRAEGKGLRQSVPEAKGAGQAEWVDGREGGRENFPFKGKKKRRGWEGVFKSLVNL